VIFFSCKANARVQDAKSRHGPHSSPPGAAASSKRLTKVAYLRFATEPVWAQNPDSQPIKFIPPITSLVPPRHQSLVRSVMALSLTSNRYRKHIPLLELRCLLQSPAMRSNAGMANRQGNVDLRFAQVSPPPQLALWLGLAWLSVILPAYTTFEGETECSELLAHKIRTLGNHPEERIQHVFSICLVTSAHCIKLLIKYCFNLRFSSA
jgi:hypothetical protein